MLTSIAWAQNEAGDVHVVRGAVPQTTKNLVQLLFRNRPTGDVVTTGRRRGTQVA